MKCQFLVYNYLERQQKFWIGIKTKNKTETQTTTSKGLLAYMPAIYSEVCTPTPLFSHLFCTTNSFCEFFDGCILNTCKTSATV